VPLANVLSAVLPSVCCTCLVSVCCLHFELSFVLKASCCSVFVCM
jgi:hypothetical protein